MAILLITHDLGVVAQLCDRVAVHVRRPARGGRPPVAAALRRAAAPLHPGAARARSRARACARGCLRVIGGQVPDLTDPPPAAASRPAARCGAPSATASRRCWRGAGHASPAGRRRDPLRRRTRAPQQPPAREPPHDTAAGGPRTSSRTSRVRRRPARVARRSSTRSRASSLELRRGESRGPGRRVGVGQETLARCMLGLTPADRRVASCSTDRGGQARDGSGAARLPATACSPSSRTRTPRSTRAGPWRGPCASRSTPTPSAAPRSARPGWRELLDLVGLSAADGAAATARAIGRPAPAVRHRGRARPGARD